MATGYEVFAKIIPDTKELDKLKREGINIKAKTTGVAGGMPTAMEGRPSPFSFLGSMGDKIMGLFGIGGGGGAGMGEAAGAGEAGAAAGGGVAGGILMGMGLLEILKKIIGFVAGLEPIQAIMAMIGSIMKMFFLPLVMMLFTLLRPILIPLLKLMPLWMKFWQDPIGSLKGLGGMLWEALVKLGKWLVDGFKSYFTLMYITIPTKIVEGITWLAGKIWDYIKDLPGKIWDAIQGIADWFGDLSGKIWEYVKGIGEWFADLPGKIWDYMKDLGGVIWDYMKALPSQIWDYMKGMADWIDALPGKIWDKMKGIGTTIADGISGIIGGLDNTLRQIPGWILNKLKGGISWLTDIGGAVANAFKDAFGALASFFAPMLNPIITVFNAIGSTLAGFVNEVSSHLPGSWRVHWTDIEPISVGDFIITKGGQVLKTSPDDYIIGTKNPQAIGGKHIENNIYVNVAGGLDDAMVQEIAYRIRQEVDRAIGVV